MVSVIFKYEKPALTNLINYSHTFPSRSMKTIFLSSNLLRVAPSQVEEKLLVLNSFLDATHINILLLSGLSKDSLNEENSDKSSSESYILCFFVYWKSWNVGFSWDWWIMQTLLTIQLVFREYSSKLVTKNNV